MTVTPSSPAVPRPATPRATAPDPRIRPDAPADGPPQCDHRDLVRYLEDRFACVEACEDCVRACARRQGPAGSGDAARLHLACADVCDATSRLLGEQTDQADRDERQVRAQVEWCRDVCLQCAALCDPGPASDTCAQACRRCARACEDFLAALG
ncbi:ferredoxin [Streptomyces sp. NPDC023327]|uniref:four-helix bundle copper-binding protein n=1 Tax=Streptomyces sp. NPDC023327 TaxID=3157088 RepID=UPI0033CA11A1